MNSIKERVLLICTEPNSSVFNGLRKTFQVETAANLQMAEFLASEWEPQICILEDKIEHLQWIPHLRSLPKLKEVSIVVFSLSSADSHEEFAFKSGCDCWMRLDKGEQLIWRVNALLRRNSTGTMGTVHHLPVTSMIVIGQLKVYLDDYLVKRLGQVVSISPTQFSLLAAF
ncbi:MAG: response regulator transcription factor, partial [Bdellovibrionales bacterium]|nr:response regulator transcription factor [Bdellovibrionales bacterium]